MSVSEITNKIKVDAEAQVEAIMTRAEEQRIETEKRQQAAIASLQTKYEATCEQLVARDRQEIIARAQHEVQIALQREKRTAVDSVLDAAYKQLRDEDTADYAKRYGQILQALALPVTTVEKVFTAPARVAVTTQILADLGITAPVEADERIDAGMRIVTAVRQYDCTLGESFRAIRPQLEIEVARTLFQS